MVFFCCPKPPKAPDSLNKSKQRRYLFEETKQKRIKEGGRADLLRQVPLYGLLVCHYAWMLRFTCIRHIGHTDHLEKGTEIMKDVYNQILLISTIAAVVTAAVALLLMNFSRSGKTVDESRAWLKRIIITWAILNSLGFIMAYVTPFFTDGRWNG